MPVIRERRGRVVLDYRDGGGKRRVPSFGPAAEPASWERAEKEQERLRFVEEDHSRLTFGAAAERWLEEIREQIDPTTWRRYEESMRLHHLPTFRALPIAKVRRRRIKEMVRLKMAERKKDGATRRYTRATIRTRVLGVLHTFFEWAVDEEILPHNPVRGLTRRLLRRKRRRDGERRRLRNMTEDHAVRWMLAVEQDKKLGDHDRLALHLMIDSGLRIGETMGVQVADIDTAARKIHIFRQVRTDPPIVDDPKSERSIRDVDLSERVRQGAEYLWARRRQAALATGQPPGPWLFFPSVPVGAEPTQRDSERARYRLEKAMWRTTRAAGLPRYTPHCLRHTWATVRGNRGANIKALQAAAGHASIQQTSEYMNDAHPELGSPDLMAEMLEQRRPQVVPIESAAATSRRSRP